MKQLLRYLPLRRRSSSRSQGMVEFALMLPVLLFLIYGMLEVGRLVFMYATVTSAAREASRYGAATGLAYGGVRRLQDCDGIKEAAKRVDFLAVIEEDQIIISYDQGPYTEVIARCPIFESEIQNGTRVRVQVSSNFEPMVPILPWSPWTVWSSAARTILLQIPVTGEIAEFVTNVELIVNDEYGNDGLGGGTFAQGELRGIEATIPTGKCFSYWDGDLASLATLQEAVEINPNLVRMPATTVTLTAHYIDALTLTVNGGFGGGSYCAGDQPIIQVDPAAIPPGESFSTWSVVKPTGLVIDCLDCDTTTLTMPGEIAEVRTDYAITSSDLWTLTVIDGSIKGNGPSGDYLKDTIVEIIPKVHPDPYYVFDQWTGEGINYLYPVPNPRLGENKIKMPAKNITIEAEHYDPFTCQVKHSGAISNGQDITWTIYNHERQRIDIALITVYWQDQSDLYFKKAICNLNPTTTWTGTVNVAGLPGFQIPYGPWRLPSSEPPYKTSTINLSFSGIAQNIRVTLRFSTLGCSQLLDSNNASQEQPSP